MGKRICYLGDNTLEGAAAYLAGVMAHYGLAFDHVPSATRLPDRFLRQSYGLYVLSDYPARNLADSHARHVVDCVRAGSGLLMIGGWESFRGQSGGYERSPLADALPVAMQSSDDRVNCAQPCLVNKVAEHEILAGLPFDVPPGVGGFNRVAAKPGAALLLTCVPFGVMRENREFVFRRGEEAPLLVVGEFGKGRTAAFATDVAPHWVGGLVDWGDRRVTRKIGAREIEVGNWYAGLLRNLLKWIGRIP